MFKIGDFSKLCRVPTSLIRYYAQIGLLEPAHVDPFTDYRYYSFDQMPRLNRILALRDLGLSLEQIRQVLTDDLSPDELRGMLRLKQAEIQSVIDEEQARLTRVAARLKQIEQEGRMSEKDVVLKSIEAQRVLRVRQILPNPNDVGTLLGETYMAVAARGIEPVAPPFAIFHDPEFKPHDLDVEIALPVAEGVKEGLMLEGGRPVEVAVIPAVASAACVVHAESYSKFDETYAALGQWIAANGYQIAGPSREVYLAAPQNEAGDGAVTEIQFPVKKA